MDFSLTRAVQRGWVRTVGVGVCSDSSRPLQGHLAATGTLCGFGGRAEQLVLWHGDTLRPAYWKGLDLLMTPLALPGPAQPRLTFPHKFKMHFPARDRGAGEAGSLGADLPHRSAA